MNQTFAVPPDPYAVLGLEPGAGDEEIRAAYLAKLKLYPPDRTPDEFERVREAYDLLRDRRQRARYMLFAVDPDQPISSLLETGLAADGSGRRFFGPGPWLAVLKARQGPVTGD